MSGNRQRQVLQEVSETLQPGDVINYEARGKGFIMKFIYRQFRRAQRKKFGKNSRYRDIHSVLVLASENVRKRIGGPWYNKTTVLSVTVPKAIVEPLRIGKRTKKVTVCRLKGAGDGFSDEWLKTMREAAKSLVGTEYDYGQILAIKLKLQGWPKWIANFFDMGKKRTVCSGGVQYCLLKAWERYSELWEEKPCDIPRPLNGREPNSIYPAHFVNNWTFAIVKEWEL